MAIPPLVIPPRPSADGGQASQSTSNVASPREIISGDVVYRLGGQFWPSRCFMKLEGDLLLMERSSKQEAAVQLSGATVELQGTCSIKVEAPSRPVLVMRWESEEETERWFHHLEAAVRTPALSVREMLKDMALSPRSEDTATPSEGKQAECARADAAEQALKNQGEEQETLQKAIQEEQLKLEKAEAEIQDLQSKLALESLQAKAMMDEQGKQKQAMLEEQEQLKQAMREEQEKHKQALLEEQEKRKQAETKFQELQDKLVKGSSEAEAKEEETSAKIKELENKVEELSSTKEAILEEQEKYKQAVATIEDLENKLVKECLQAQALEEKLAKASKKAQAEQEESEAQIQELKAKVEEQSTVTVDLKAALSQLQLFQRRLASAEQRLQGEVQWRTVAEASRDGAEQRLAEMEELLLKNSEKLSLSGRPLSPRNAQAVRGKLELELKQLENVKDCKKVEEEKVKVLQARVQHLETQLDELNSDLSLIELDDPMLSQEQLAKAAALLHLEVLQSNLILEEGEAASSVATEKDSNE